MDELINLFPKGIFDIIFSDPPYFLSIGSITFYAGTIAKVDKSDWDKSKLIEENHKLNPL